MDNIRTRSFKIYCDYIAKDIDYEEFKKRIKVIEDELKTKQGSLKLKKKEVTP